MGWFIHSLNAKQKIIALAVAFVAWVVWANTGGPMIMGAIEAEVRPNMEALADGTIVTKGEGSQRISAKDRAELDQMIKSAREEQQQQEIYSRFSED